jgi:hypothetical protein
MKTVLLAFGLLCGALNSAGAQSPASYAWVQWEADGRPHARAIVSGTACPSLTVGAMSFPMTLRSGPQGNFSDTVCDLPYPVTTNAAHVGELALPKVPKAPAHIIVFGDSGCRLKGAEVQACNDPKRWPFATLAKQMAALKPDLVIDVGDYYYRETACPPSGVDCAGSPYGDRTESWVADYFAPATPLFAVAPIIHVRGNHEDCQRSPLGWARYLSGFPGATCSKHEDPFVVAFDNLQVAQTDSAYGDETNAADPLFIADEQFVDALAGSRETWLITHRPPVAYLAAHIADESNGTHLAAIISGHIHIFAAASFAHAPPQLIVGTGGDNLASTKDAELLRGSLGALADARFGFAAFDRDGSGWNIGVHGPDGAIAHRCRLEARKVSCT